MSKGAPRHDPDKPQNKYGGDFCCENFEERSNGEWCHDEGQAEQQTEWIKWAKTDDGKLRCKGNPHNCGKEKLKWLASLSEKERTNHTS